MLSLIFIVTPYFDPVFLNKAILSKEQVQRSEEDVSSWESYFFWIDPRLHVLYVSLSR